MVSEGNKMSADKLQDDAGKPDAPKFDKDTLALVQLKIRLFNPKVKDKSATAEVCADKSASYDSVGVVKAVVPKERIVKITKLASQIRMFVATHSGFWPDDGVRTIRTKRLGEFRAGFSALRDEFNQAADEFSNDWTAIRESAKMSLGQLFNEQDYPDEKTIRDRFECTIHVYALPDVGSLRDVAGCFDEIFAENETRIQAAISEARLEPLKQMATLLGHMADTLKVDDKIFRDSMVENLKDLLATEEDVVVVDDPEIKELFQKVRESVAGYTPDALRKDTTMRHKAADDAAGLVAEVGKLVNRKLAL